MNAHPRPWVADNAAWAGAAPRLSVLTPFLRDDPCALLAALERQAGVTVGQVEVVVLDDGSGDAALAARVSEAVQSLNAPARFVRLAANEGRARGRNRLAGHARARHLLFLDSDMLPDGPDFLAAYLDLIATADPAVAFGGLSVLQASRAPELALHRAMAAKSDCLPAARRKLQPEKTVFTSNLLIRRDVFEAEGFDEGFQGWGWEDVEWAARVARKHAITHLDNPASHLGLDTSPTLVAKYRQSVANFGRLVRAHPDLVRAYPSVKAARLIARLPLRAQLRAMLERLVIAPNAPLPLRALAMRLLRAALYAEAVGAPAQEAYEPDRSLAGKLRRRWMRLYRRRPARCAGPRRPRLSITFDDAPVSAARLGADIVSAHGGKASYYIAANLLGTDGPMGPYAAWTDLERLHAQGHEIGCHTFDHADLGRVSADAALKEAEDNRAALAAHGLPAPQTFAYPYGEVSAAPKAALAPRFALLRGLHRGLVAPGADLNQAPSIGLEGPNGEALVMRWLDRAARRQAWMIVTTHDVQPCPSRWGCTPEALGRVLDRAAALGFQIVTVAEGARQAA
ncbi:MAG TPA: polysaccharide deacetylase family protein [Caulobacteraceae bacterium]|nr:polysaccharide deacetylase family protein [Caulobacteraceae bacterium]